MMDSLESRVARFLARQAVNATSKLVKYLYRIETPGLEEHFSTTEREKPALFLIKHQHMVEYFVGLYSFRQVVKKQATIPVKESLFRNRGVAAFLNAAGAIPIRRPTDEGYDPHSPEAKTRYSEMIRNFGAGGWYAYCPEGTRKWGVVGIIDRKYLGPMLLAVRQGIDVYIVGVEYKQMLHVSPWMPFLTKVVMRFEKYEPKGKSMGQITQEIREKMAELSGLEGKLETEQTFAAAGGTANKSAAGYN